jgi:hypothetical protein
MVVAITPNLEYLQEGLRSLGHKVVIIGAYNYPIDAMIYTGYSGDLSYITANNLSNDQKQNYGILMINAQNKSLKEIDRILRTRLYSPLF